MLAKLAISVAWLAAVAEAAVFVSMLAKLAISVAWLAAVDAPVGRTEACTFTLRLSDPSSVGATKLPDLLTPMNVALAGTDAPVDPMEGLLTEIGFVMFTSIGC
jgi:hypothetical protein